jgi:hypothetical protein
MTRVRAVGVWLWRLVAALAVVRWAVEVVGELVISAGLAAVILVWGVGRWAALERRLDSHPGPAYRPVAVARGPGRMDQAGERVAFARAGRRCRPSTGRTARTRPPRTRRRGRGGGEHDDR